MSEEAHGTTGPSPRVNEDVNFSQDFGGLLGGFDENSVFISRQWLSQEWVYSEPGVGL